MVSIERRGPSTSLRFAQDDGVLGELGGAERVSTTKKALLLVRGFRSRFIFRNWIYQKSQGHIYGFSNADSGCDLDFARASAIVCDLNGRVG